MPPELSASIDDELDDYFFRAFLKAVLIGGMVWFTVKIFSGSISKAAVLCALCFVLALFSTWRRYLEPVAFVGFVAAAICWCDPVGFARTARTVASATGLL
jgi:hypothetical protein